MKKELTRGENMAETWETKDKLKPRGLEGISDTQIDNHFDVHYKGYVNKLNEIWSKLPDADRSKANQNYSDFRALKLEETFNYGGSLLHELYFEGLTPKHSEVPKEFKDAVAKDFGSYEKWLEDFKATGTAFRGWAILVYDLNYGKLRNIGSDAHNVGLIWNSIAVLTMDVYEHAYYVDYGAKRAPYLDAFMKNVNWPVVMDRLNRAKKAYEAFKK